MSEKLEKSEEEWRKQLTPEEYHVTREKGTERAFTGRYWDSKDEGVYVCVCCGQPLFSSETKYESGTGWPSFSSPVDPNSVATHSDRSFGMTRTEVLCPRCDAHLGHVFEAGIRKGDRRFHGGVEACARGASQEEVIAVPCLSREV